MDVAETEIRSVVNRLHRVQGQIAGIEKMLDEGRDCRDVARQMSAATRALERAGVQFLVANLTACLRDEDAAKAEGLDADELQRLFLQLA